MFSDERNYTRLNRDSYFRFLLYQSIYICNIHVHVTCSEKVILLTAAIHAYVLVVSAVARLPRRVTLTQGRLQAVTLKVSHYHRNVAVRRTEMSPRVGHCTLTGNEHEETLVP